MLHFIMGLIFFLPCIFLDAHIRLEEVTSLETGLEFGQCVGALLLPRFFVIPLKCRI